MPAETTAPPGPSAEVNFAELYRRLDEARAVLERGQSVSEAHRKEVLAARARALAGSREEVRQELLSVLAFQVGGERYAVPLTAVDHVLEARGLCPLPGAPRHVLGALVEPLAGGGGAGPAPAAGARGRRHVRPHPGGGGGRGRGGLRAGGGVGGGAARAAARGADAAAPGPFTHLGPQRLTILDLEQLGDAGAARRE